MKKVHLNNLNKEDDHFNELAFLDETDSGEKKAEKVVSKEVKASSTAKVRKDAKNRFKKR
ncbi:hypothetical protein DVH26_22715 [Paenibacillus sp. H1-7]|nr:hypothetical protein DVH26_22715 [Paenibacillus sp. H1-7]